MNENYKNKFFFGKLFASIAFPIASFAFLMMDSYFLTRKVKPKFTKFALLRIIPREQTGQMADSSFFFIKDNTSIQAKSRRSNFQKGIKIYFFKKNFTQMVK